MPSFFVSKYMFGALFSLHKMSAVEKESLGANNESPIGELSLLLLCGIYSENAPDHACGDETKLVQHILT